MAFFKLQTGKNLFGFLILFFSYSSYSNVLHVGPSQVYTTLSQAAAAVSPGDTIMIHENIYSGGTYISNLQGTANAEITIMPFPGDTVIYSGGGTGWQLTDAAYLRIYGIIFEQQTANGFNMDDGGTYDTPSHHVLFDGCTFRNINATGNNDLLKLSGLDSFEVRNCLFLNGSAGGSGVDMVGCHYGVFKDCHFENMGSNAIQAKGGTQYIRMERNFFKNCGQRAVNLGGSTGLQFFRPIDATFEAADLQVYSSIFIGSVAPIAYVGCVRVEVVNNTIYTPGNWVIRILQETVDTSRFEPCGDNTFRNNIIYRGNSLSTDCNIGPNTAPQTFHFSNNLWYNYQDSGWPGPILPVTDSNNIVGSNPLFTNASAEDFSISMSSPAMGNGYTLIEPVYDYAVNAFAPLRSIGAFEADVATYIASASASDFKIFPIPFTSELNVQTGNHEPSEIAIYNILSSKILHLKFTGSALINTEQFSSGMYVYAIRNKNLEVRGKLMKE
jgi:hypothetical protein